MKKVFVFLLSCVFLFNSCSIISKVYVRNYFEHDITVQVDNLWIEAKTKTSTTKWVKYTPSIVNINSSTYKLLNDSLEMSYDANGKLDIKIPAKSTVLLEVMFNAAPAQNIEVKVLAKPMKTDEERLIAKYTIADVKRQRFHKYCLDIMP